MGIAVSHRFFARVVLLCAVCCGLLLPVAAQSQPLDAATHQLARDIFRQLIEIRTTHDVGNTAATLAMEKRFVAAGYAPEDIFVGGLNPQKQNLVVRLRGTGEKKPILFIGHLDVVAANREDWSLDPFVFTEKDGYYYGRGTQDMKNADAAMVVTFLRLKQEGYRPNRDLILALTADEEAGGDANGVEWLLANHRPLMDAQYALNPDGGGVELENGRALAMELVATEKLYADFLLTTTNPGGHSSLPVPENAIYHMATAVEAIARHGFPVELNPVTRAYFSALARQQKGEVRRQMEAVLGNTIDLEAAARLSAASSLWNAQLHTTCVVTRLNAGHAANALPQKAEATVNCRILPGHTIAEVGRQLTAAIADPQVHLHWVDYYGQVQEALPERMKTPPSAPNPELMAAMAKLTEHYWPGTPVVPTMATGASDNIYTEAAGIPSYQVSGFALEISDVRAHGRDERLPVGSFDRGVEFQYQLTRALSSQE